MNCTRPKPAAEGFSRVLPAGTASSAGCELSALDLTLRALRPLLSSPDVTQPILNELVNRRLLAYEDRHHTRRVELTHDVIIPVIKTSRDTRLMREALAQAELRERLAQE